MMSSGVAFCPFCGKPAVSGAVCCAYCGKAFPTVDALSQAGPDAAARAIPIPDRATLKGECAILYVGSRPLDIPRVGKYVAAATGAPLPDVTRRLRSSRGFIAEGLPADAARGLAESIEHALKLDILLIPESDRVRDLPEMRMHRIRLDAKGIQCDAYTWDQTEPLASAWEDVFLISGGRIETQRVSEVEKKPGRSRNPFDRFVPELVTERRHEFVMDVILHSPWRKLRLDYNTNAYIYDDRDPDPKQALIPLQECARGIQQYGRVVPRNRGIDLIANRAGEPEWESYSFVNKQDFAAYTSWLIHLVRYGKAIL